jgi:outer membrane protein TolC
MSDPTPDQLRAELEALHRGRLSDAARVRSAERERDSARVALAAARAEVEDARAGLHAIIAGGVAVLVVVIALRCGGWL